MMLGLGASQTMLSLNLSLPNNNNNTKNSNNAKWGNAKTNPKTKALSITMMTAASPSNSNYPLASRIMVRNLGYSIGESSLQKEFSSFGQVAEGKFHGFKPFS
uniref:Putative RNA-binding protein 3 n=1 Tax=Rhizophora mucronata TaxID=61149 RepID=A0A2P2JF54_RHIMU